MNEKPPMPPDHSDEASDVVDPRTSSCGNMRETLAHQTEREIRLESLRQAIVKSNRKFGRHGFERKDRRENDARMPYAD